MMQLIPLVIAPSPIFSQPCQPVSHFDDALKTLCQNMLYTLHHHKALGIGANMLGITQAIMVIDLGQPEQQPYVMINPNITEFSKEITFLPEASLSFPGIQEKIRRSASLTLTYQDTEGKPHTLKADHLLARVIQHEYDYLQGQTFLDHLSKMRQKIALSKLKR
jgi:peptide deformylase